MGKSGICSTEPWKDPRDRMGQGNFKEIMANFFFPELLKHTHSYIREV